MIVSREVVLTGSATALSAPTRAAAERAKRLYRFADGWTAGGAGLVGSPEIALRRAWLDLVLGRPVEALPQLQRAVGDSPSREARIDLARVRALAGAKDEAVQDLRALVRESPVDVEAHRALSQVLDAKGETEAAAAEGIIVISLDPGDDVTRGRLVAMLERLGRTEDAARYRR